MDLAAASNNLLLSAVCLVGTNVLLHLLSGFGVRSAFSAEAAVKHLVFTSVAAALFFYGCALVFGATGTLNLTEMHASLLERPLPPSVAVTVFTVFFLAICSQLAAFPMHFWAADVLEGAPTPVSAFVSVGSPALGIAIGTRLLVSLFVRSVGDGAWEPMGVEKWPEVLGWVAGGSMAVGTLLALRQSGAKRLVGSLVVAQTGFLLIGLLELDRVGLAALLYGLLVELFAVLGCFYLIGFFQDRLGSDRLQDWKGMLRRSLLEVLALVFFLGSLVGAPPFPSFIAKFALVGAALEQQRFLLATVAIGSWGLSWVAVTRIVFVLVGDFRGSGYSASVWKVSRRVDLLLFFLPLVLLGLFADRAMLWARGALSALSP
jgi:NADH-quinone oxidoreductase subunit N